MGETDISAVTDRHEDVSSMKPLLISQASRHRAKLTDLVVELTNKSARFRGSLSTLTAEALSELVLSMNCYYSNLIEGHDTHPRDIERSLRNVFPALFPDQASPQLALSYKDAALATQLRLTRTLRDIAARFKVSRDDVQQAIADYQAGDRW